MKTKRNKRNDKKEIITVMCYDNEEIWGDRKEAIDFYLECMSFSDGAERERYSAILEQLMTGNTYCTDEYY